MPYSIKTKDGITINNIPDDVATDSQSLKDRVAAIRANLGTAPVDATQEGPGALLETPILSEITPPPQQEPPGFLGGLIEGAKGVARDVREAVTGTRRSAAPDVAAALAENRTIYDMPEANQLSFGMLKSTLGGSTAGSEERAKIFAANFPGLTYRLDEQGTVFLRSPTDGKEYVIEPGLTVQDVPRAALMAALFTPAGRAVSIPAAIMAGGATQAAIEMSQQETGGEFNPGEVLAAAAMGPAGQILQRAGTGLKNVVQNLRGKVPPVIASGFRPGVPPVATNIPAGEAVDSLAGVPRDLGPVELVDRLGGGFRDAPRVEQVVPVATNIPVPKIKPMSAQELAPIARDAATGSAEATRILREQALPDTEVVEAAERLSILDNLQPSHYTTNQVYKEFSRAVNSSPGSTSRVAETKGLVQVAKRADDIITELGGMSDLSQMNQDVRNELAGTVAGLTTKADEEYLKLRKTIPAAATGPADNVMKFLNQRIKDLGGKKADLSRTEKYVLYKMRPRIIPPTPTPPTPIENLRDSGIILPITLMDPEKKIVETTLPTYTLPTYTRMDDVRMEIGRAINREGMFKDAETGAAKNLYDLIEKDQFNLANKFNYGPQYRTAKSLVSLRKAVEDDMVSLFGRQIDQSFLQGLETATTSLSKGDADSFAKLIKAIPANMRQKVTASALTTAFGELNQKGTLDFNTYANWFEGLKKNKQAYAALMNNLPEGANKILADFYMIANGVRMAGKENLSSEAIQGFRSGFKAKPGHQGVDSLLSKIYRVGKRAAVGIPLEALTSAAGAPGAGLAAGIASALSAPRKLPVGTPDVTKSIDALIGSPAFISLATTISRPTNATTGGPVTKAIRRVAMSKEFRRFSDAVKLPKTLDARIQWIQSALQTERQLSPDEQPEPQQQTEAQ
jgi:hypothetical protein